MSSRPLIEITTTATIRPGLLDVTYQSFRNKLLHDNPCRLLINIDPVGERDKTPEDVLKVARKHFDDVKYRIAPEPNYARAVQWGWENSTEEFVLHLEDDWRLAKRLSVDNMISNLRKNPDLVGLRLSKLKITTQQCKAGEFDRHRKIMLNPTLFCGWFVREMAARMDIEQNPEYQIKRFLKYMKENWLGGYLAAGPGRYVKHLGRQWMKEQGIKHQRKSLWITWKPPKRAT